MARALTWVPGFHRDDVGRDDVDALVASARRAPSLRVAIVTGAQVSAPAGEGDSVSPDRTSCRLGVELGIDEAARAATLLGGSATLAAAVDGVDAARALMGREQLSAIVCLASADEVADLATAAVRHRVAVFNTLATSDALRNERCSRAAFHIAPSDAMLAGVRRRSDGTVSPEAADAVRLWDPELERYGARQLNDRFVARFRRPMDSLAWAGWFAVKAAWEGSQRARSPDGASIGTYLEQDSTRFDGHKGVPLSFRPWDHQLRQPLYVGPSLATVPAADTLSAHVALDRIGTSREGTRCRW